LLFYAGETVDIPTYDFATAARCSEVTHVDTADIILFDGILAFYDPEVRFPCCAGGHSHTELMLALCDHEQASATSMPRQHGPITSQKSLRLGLKLCKVRQYLSSPWQSHELMHVSATHVRTSEDEIEVNIDRLHCDILRSAT
jgi:hypothetical protein